MKTEREYIDCCMAICAKDWFKDHQAEWIIGERGMCAIKWENPDSWNYGCRIILHRRWLIVVGDIGEAVYEWSNDVTLQWLAGLELSYFLGKCQASESGRKFTLWEPRIAHALLSEWLAENPDNNHDALKNISEHNDREEFRVAVQEAYDDGLDPEACSDISGFGEVPHARAIGHFVAIKMAWEQLKEKEHDFLLTPRAG